eukprot:TRINITY_DN23173_c1_g1_i2.p1 TRINITY_DN23173_c1_g1~~TRINITY_DN23173_c1_g1_i2.p1  ORF type:complete len:351 (-),score=55.54 TRINITY_DN23173_c1_g1_i2:295-1347(-)
MKKAEPHHIVSVADEPILYRDPTDLVLPDEDVLITGATGDNDVLNGLYFRVSGNFGLSIYKHVVVKMRSGTFMDGAPQVHQRFLWMDETKGPASAKGWWVISEKPKGALVQGPGMAFVDDNAPNPGSINKSWYVWHPQSRSMKFYSTEGIPPEDLAKMRPGKELPDNIQSKSIVGFEIMNGSDSFALAGPTPGLMLRAACSELYGRPVYEAENGGQYMYWLQDGGSVESGMPDPAAVDEDTFLSNPEEYFKNEGCWIIASAMGVPKDAPECLAYCKDFSVTPELTKNEAWMVRMKPYDPSQESVFDRNPKFRLRLEEWTRADEMIASFDEAQPAAPTGASSSTLALPAPE